MTQAELNQAVAQATGESVATIKHLGFLLADEDESADLDASPMVIDWDALEADRFASAEYRRTPSTS